MNAKRLGPQTIRLAKPPIVEAFAAVAGPVEAQGPLGHEFDQTYPDLTIGQSSFEKAERVMLEDACKLTLKKAGEPAIDYMVAGDLLNQIATSNFAALQMGYPFFGVYGACSTFCESISLGAMLIDGGFADRVLCATGSHNATAERQYRYPVEYGSQKRPYAQHTVTGAGAVLLAAQEANRQETGPRITHITTGKVVDMGIADPFNQGAAMAPAAIDTIEAHLRETGRQLGYYDLIVTGDLARFGREMAVQLGNQRKLDLGDKFGDCGIMIYDAELQEVEAGGSGCGCSAIVTCGHLLKEMRRGTVRRLLLVATGALLSPTTFQQGENIPAIAHAVAFEL